MSDPQDEPAVVRLGLLESALAAIEAGISVHPCQEDGSKAPSPIYETVDEDGKTQWTWLHPPGQPPDRATVESWYGPRRGFGLRCGSESGGLECLEFDDRDAYDRLKHAALACSLGDLIARIEAGYCEESPSGGIHWLYYTDEIRGNTKLAKRPAPTETSPHAAKTKIETRGENGFILCAPTGGSVHPSGKSYVLKSGGLASIVTLSGPERDALWDLAKSFDEMPKKTSETKTRGRPPSDDSLRPGDDFNQRAEWKDILEGWTEVYSRGDTTYWRRPEKSIGISASTNRNDSDLLWVFTTSTSFESEASYTKFGAYALLHHGGNHNLAASSLRKEGYGGKRDYVSSEDAVNAFGKTTRRPTGTDGPHAEPKSEPESDDDDSNDDIVDLRPQIDAAAFHGIAGEIVRASDPHTEADPVAVLLQFLTGFANALGHGPYWVAGATRHYLVLFVALVGSTSVARKGQSWDVARYFLGKLDDEWATTRIARGLSTGEGLIHHIRDKRTKMTEDGEIVEDEGVPDKRIFCIESELGRTLKAMNRESNTLSGVLREAWDCSDRLATLTKKSPDVASNPHVSLVAHITAEELGDLLTRTDSANGLGNRFLWAYVQRSKKLPHGGNFFDQEPEWGGLFARLRKTFEWCRGVTLMRRDPAIDVAWEVAYNELTENRPGLLGSMLARAEPQVMRIACIYALLDGSNQVRAEHLTAALAIWDYLEASARFIFGNSLADPKAEILLKALKASPQGLTRSQISSDVFSRHLDKKALDRVLQYLSDRGLVHLRKHDTDKPGRKAELWFYGANFRPRI